MASGKDKEDAETRKFYGELDMTEDVIEYLIGKGINARRFQKLDEAMVYKLFEATANAGTLMDIVDAVNQSKQKALAVPTVGVAEQGNNLTVAIFKQHVQKNEAGKEIQAQVQHALAQYTDPTEHLLPAPLAIGIIGQLIVISTKADFELRIKKLDLLKYPESFRACLLQVAHGARDAFTFAHKRMDEIRCLAIGLPTEFADVLQFIMQDIYDDDTEESILIKIHDIKETADLCKTKAAETEAKFNYVTALISELTQATTGTQGSYEKDQKAAEAAKVAAQSTKEALQKRQAKREAELAKICKQRDEADEEVMKQYKAMPGIATIVGLSFLDDLRDGFGLKSLLVKPAQQIFSGVANAGAAALTSVQNKSEAAKEQKQERKELLLKCAEKAEKWAAGLIKYCIDTEANEVRYPDENGEINLQYVKSLLAEDQTSLKGIPAEMKYRCDVAETCTTGINLCSQIMQSKGNSTGSGNLVKEIYDFQARTQALRGSLQAYVDKTSAIPAATPAQPNVASSGANIKFAQVAVEQAQVRLEQAKSIQKGLQERYEVQFQESMLDIDKMNDVLRRISEQNIAEIQFSDILKTLQEGMEALAALEERWGQISHFFAKISTVISTLLTKRSHDFCKQLLKGGAEDQLRIPKLAAFQQLFRMAQEAVGYAEAVSMLTTNYVSLSDKHLLPAVNSLSAILSCDKTQPGALQLKKDELNSKCDEAVIAIRETCKKGHREFQRNAAKQMATLQRRMLEQ